MKKRIMNKVTGFLTATLIILVAMLSVFPGSGSVTKALDGVHWQVAFLVDGSGSISSTEWGLMTNGLAGAIEDPTCMPHNGTVELWVIQFAGETATLEIGATVIDSLATAQAVANHIRTGIAKRGGYTPTGEAFKMAREELVAHMNPEAKQFINLITNGHPQPETTEVPKAIAERNAAIAAGIDEIDSEALGVLPEWLDWLRDEIVYPEPGVQAPPYPEPPGSQGWVRLVETFEEFAEAICDKFERIFLSLYLEPIEDTNLVGDEHTVIATYEEDGVPVAGVEVHFTITDGPHAGMTGSDTTDADGKATFTYPGTAKGTDTIVASIDYNGDGVDDIFSNQVFKHWRLPPDLTLRPPEEINQIGQNHTVIATYTDNDEPVEGMEVFFEVTDGPHAGMSGSDTTDSNGEATFTYEGLDIGTDTIIASVDTDGDGTADLFSNTVTKEWIHSDRITGVTIWSSLVGVAALIGTATVLARRRRSGQIVNRRIG
jgi:hypothetical protein